MGLINQIMNRPGYFAKLLGVTVLLTLVSLRAQAGDSAVAFHGYGQFICGSTLSSTHSVLSVSNLEYNGSVNCGPESWLGLQMDVKANDHITFTAQALDRPKDRSAPNHPELEIGSLTFDYGDDWPTVSVGRQKIPWYMYSPNRQVGESYIWVRPPMSVYFEPADSFDGISFSKNVLLGNWVLKPSVGYGWFHTNHNNLPADGSSPYRVDFSVNHAYGAGFELYYSSLLRFRAAYFSSVISIRSDQTDELFKLLNTLREEQTVEQLVVDHRSSLFKEVGVQFTPGHWNLEAEFIQNSVTDTYLPKAEDYFVSAGYRFGRFTPALTYSHAEQAASRGALQVYRPNLCDIFLNGLCRSYVETLLDKQAANDRFYELSLRYDVTPHVALKLDMTVLDSGVSNHQSSNLLSSGITFYF